MKINRKDLTTYAAIVILGLTGIILIHFYYPFIHPYESHLLLAGTSILIALLVSFFRKMPLNLHEDFRPSIIFILCYLGLMSINAFLSSDKTELLITDVVHKEIVGNTRKKNTYNYYALVKIPQYSLLRFNETARLRISKKAYEHLQPEKYQAKVEVKVGMLKQPFIVDFNFHDKNKNKNE